MSATTVIAGPIRRPAFDVTLITADTRGRYRIEASSLDALADLIEAEIRQHNRRDHVGVRLDPEHGIWVRYGFAPSIHAGTWRKATR